MSTRFSLVILRLVLAMVVGGYSGALAWSQIRGSMHLPLLVLAVAELGAAILFLIPKTVRPGGIALLVIFAIAAGFHFLHGEYNVVQLALYAAATLAVISYEGTPS